MLEEAARRYGAHVDVRWHAYELRPDPIPQPDPGGPYITEHWLNRVLPMAAERGVVMTIPRRQIRSRRALQASLFAQAHGGFLDFDRAVFRARFEADADISDIGVLADLAREVGLDAEAMAHAVTTGSYLDELTADLTLASRLGVDGVPAAFVGPETAGLIEFFAKAEPVVGAVPFEWLARAIDRALHSFSDEHNSDSWPQRT